ncbi:MAG TPA: hypothetical protein VM370_06180 [Candidatus Thermoplasmatota archaeon]|nr:hypothetical protein [Candidatus Thermoplasmatota archaeon]
MPRGRRTPLREDTTPGKVLALALLANVPILLAFVLVLLFTGGDTAAARRYTPAVLFVTPLFAVLSILIHARAPAERKAHRASRIGLMLAIVALGLWVLVLIPSLRG